MTLSLWVLSYIFFYVTFRQMQKHTKTNKEADVCRGVPTNYHCVFSDVHVTY